MVIQIRTGSEPFATDFTRMRLNERGQDRKSSRSILSLLFRHCEYDNAYSTTTMWKKLFHKLDKRGVFLLEKDREDAGKARRERAAYRCAFECVDLTATADRTFSHTRRKSKICVFVVSTLPWVSNGSLCRRPLSRSSTKVNDRS